MRLIKINILLVISTLYLSAEDFYIQKKSTSNYLINFNPTYSDKKIKILENEFIIPEFKNNSSLEIDKNAKYDLRFYTFPIEVNSRIGNSINIINAEFENFNNFNIAPTQTIEIKSGKIEKKYSTDNISNPKSELVSIEKYFEFQDKLYAFVKISPLEYNPNSKILKRLKNIEFEINVNLENQKVTVQNKLIQTSIFAEGSWWKFPISEDGLYKIDYNLLKNLGISLNSINSIYDISVFGGDGIVLPKSLITSNRTVNQQLALKYFDINGNGKFDEVDYIIFYAKGVTGWNYFKNEKIFRHYTNPYTNNNSYFLRIQNQSTPKIINSKKILFNNSTPITQVGGKVFFDEEKSNLTHSGLEWYSAPLNPNETKIYSVKLNGFAPNTPIFYNVKVLARANIYTNFLVDESGQNFGNINVDYMSDEELGGDPIGEFARTSTQTFTHTPTLVDKRTVLKFTYKAQSSNAVGYIDYAEIFYKQNLEAETDQIYFASPETTGVIKYSLKGFSKNSILIFDVTEIFNQSQITENLEQQFGTFTFVDEHSSRGIKNYFIGTTESAKTISSATKLPNFNLRSDLNSGELIIITPNSFLSEAKRLKVHKESLKESISTSVVQIDSIFNEFSFGMPDPLSIREFLIYAKNNFTTKPKYVLLFGDASFDYKEIYKNDKSLIPTYETEEGNVQIITYNYDDIFASLDILNEYNVSIGIGRATVKNQSDAKVFVDKIIEYEKGSIRSDWRNLIAIVSDDRNVNDQIDGAPNDDQSEMLAENYVPKSFNLKKIFIGDYPTQITSVGRRKNEARQSVIDQINNGAIVMNYIGHGNPKVWAHERIFTIDDTEGEFSNRKKMPFIIAATCDWGRFDEAGETSSAEEIVLNPTGGAIAVLSATRVVFSGDNASTNYMLYKHLFPQNIFLKSPTIGEAIAFAKNDPGSGSLDNNQKYHLIGDPSLKLLIPKLVFTVDSINGKKVTENFVDTLKPLSKVKIVGSVRNENQTILNNLNGSGLISVYDAARRKTISDLGLSFTFMQPGATIFRGNNSISNGILKSEFIVPKDISYEKSKGKLSLYFTTDTIDGRGFSTNFIIGGESNTNATDKIGPEIKIFIDNKNFKSGDLVSSEPKLIIEFFDSSGINSTGSGIGHRIESWIDNASTSTDLTEHYQGKTDTFMEGILETVLKNLSSGEHNLKIKAWDNFNNSNISDVKFKIANEENMAILEAFAIPNPMKKFTNFTFQQNQNSPIDVKINIYTIAGRLVNTIERFSLNEHFIKIAWDGRDSDGDEIGNGVYLFNIEATTIDGSFKNSTIGKLVIAN